MFYLIHAIHPGICFHLYSKPRVCQLQLPFDLEKHVYFKDNCLSLNFI